MSHQSATLLIAHGSRDKLWQAPFFQLHQQIEKSSSQTVALAFMELCQPSIEEAVEKLISTGVQQINVLPLFFAEGKHLRIDVPKQLQQLEEKHQITLTLMPAVGQNPEVIKAIEKVIVQQVQ